MLFPNKIIKIQNLENKIDEIRSTGRTIATLNGSFDILHAGHLYMLSEAAKVADILLLLVNSDESVRSYKGEERPFIPLHERMEMLAAITFVDYVTSFEETDPRSILRKIRPDVHVNGEEYGEECIEAMTVRECGGKLHLVKRIPGLATSALVEKIRSVCV